MHRLSIIYTLPSIVRSKPILLHSFRQIHSHSCLVSSLDATDGQYFTFADKFNGSFRQPATDEDPMIAVLAALASPSIEKKVDSALYVDGKSTSGRSISSSSTSGSSGNSSEVSDDDSGFEEIEGQVSFSGIIAGGNGQRIKVE